MSIDAQAARRTQCSTQLKSNPRYMQYYRQTRPKASRARPSTRRPTSSKRSARANPSSSCG
eukprot:10409939-Alexandrium_andersonii.AAC.1